jgi:hypothetical protein
MVTIPLTRQSSGEAIYRVVPLLPVKVVGV